MLKVVIIGAGAGGLALGHHLRRAGVDDFVILEKGDGVGGTWRSNTYPGAECDVPSHLYSFSFLLNPDWSKSFAGQAEILAYLEHAADVLGLRPHLRLSTAVASATWRDDLDRWEVCTEHGEVLHAGVVVSAVGMFNAPSWPDLRGLDDFAGPVMHSARWDHAVDLGGRRVGVIGTGASAVQIVPAIADSVAHLDVFQRSPAWIMPRGDKPFSDEDRRRFAAHPLEARRLRRKIYDFYESGTIFRLDDPRAEVFESFARAHLESSVPDPVLRASLTPDYPVGCKRILVSDEFYPTLQRDHVALVTPPIEAVTPTGVRTSDGADHPVDTLVLATGYRAVAYLHGLEVVGRDGRRLHDEWADEPRAYLGLAAPGFPNFFVLYGPNTNQAGNSILLILEAQARYVVRLLAAMDASGADVAEVTPEAMAAYNRRLDADLEGTVWTAGCGNYFRTPSGHVATQLPHPASWYVSQTRRPTLADYRLTRADAARAGQPL